MALIEHAQWVEEFKGASDKVARINALNEVEIYASDGTTLLGTLGAATNSTTLNLGSHVGSVSVGYYTNWIACPVDGTLARFGIAVTSNDSNNAFTVELERRVTPFAANPVLTLVGAGVVGNILTGPIGDTVVAGDQFRAIVTVADGATPPQDLNATISLTGVS